MAERSGGLRISKKAFLTSFLVLLALMIGAGLLAATIPSGLYERVMGDFGLQVVPNTYRVIEKPNYPIWRWLTAPFEVLASGDGLQAIVIIIFIMIVGGAFAILDKASVLKEAVSLIAKRFASRRYLLLALITLFFMGIGSLLGIFEETIPLVACGDRSRPIPRLGYLCGSRNEHPGDGIRILRGDRQPFQHRYRPAAVGSAAFLRGGVQDHHFRLRLSALLPLARG